MTQEDFDELSLIKERITKQNTVMRSAIVPELKLAYNHTLSCYRHYIYRFAISVSSMQQ